MKIKKINKLKTNNYGFGHMEIILVVLVVAIIGVVGFTVFNNHKTSSSLKATAAVPRYTTLGKSHGITVSACKTYNSIYGGIYSVKVIITKDVNTTAYAYDISDLNGTTSAISQHTFSNAYWAGTVASYTINMSVVNKDYITIIAPDVITSSTIQIVPGSAWSGYTRGINNIKNC